jgi:CNT family concentrative nucleoside transporter
MYKIISFFGLLALIAIAYGLSTSRKHINWKTVIAGVFLQILIALIILKTSLGQNAFEHIRVLAIKLLDFTNEGSAFIFGDLIKPDKFGFIFAFIVLPTIIFVSSLTSVLYHLNILQKVVEGCAFVMMKVMGTSGAESLSAAANIFAGQTEAPLVVKPYIPLMTKSELLALMTGGMATIAGGVLAAYVGMGIDAGHLLAASVMSAPAALVCAKLMVPETEVSQTAGVVKVKLEKTSVNVIDAATEGAGEGLKLALNVAAMLLAVIALVAMLNAGLGMIGGWFGWPQLSFELVSGYLFSPIAFLMGVPWNECIQVGGLLGKKMVINEFVAYVDLKEMIPNLSSRAVTISTYALCGFANFSSIAIQIGGIGTLAPNRKKDLAELGIKSLIAGSLACFMTACVASFFID